jgi:DNA-binding GntR family transcriptional regulator
MLTVMVSPTLRERVADALREAILDGSLTAGSELRQEKLADQFGVSRIPIREALQMLQRDGLIMVLPNRRVCVADITEESILDHASVRALIEGEVAFRSASLDVSALALDTAEADLKSASDRWDPPAIVAANVEFHQTLWDMCGSNELKALARQFWSGRDYTPPLRKENILPSYREHLEIAELVRGHKPELARDAMKEHVIAVAVRLQAYRNEVAKKRPARRKRRDA